MNTLPHEVRGLECPTGHAGRMINPPVASRDYWNLSVRKEREGEEEVDDSDDDSGGSDESRITVETPPTYISLSTQDASADFALTETPPEKRNKTRKRPDDCHILVRWSSLVNLIKNNLTCSCGKAIKHLDRHTVGIATNIHYRCDACLKQASALADESGNPMAREEDSETTFIRRERRIDSYDLNWRLIMATQLMGESQVGGSIIGFFYI